MDEQVFLNNYDEKKYKKPSLTVDINIFSVSNGNLDVKAEERLLEVLLIKRGCHPFQGMYALPGGFVHNDETVEAAARRELLEETGIDCNFLEQIKVFSDPHRDPRYWVITCAFMALVDQQKYCVRGGDDAQTAEWFQISMRPIDETNSEIIWDLIMKKGSTILNAKISQQKNERYELEYPHLTLISSNQIAFDHALIIAHAILQIRRIIKTTPVAFELLPRYFTLSEVQRVYETILDTKLLAPAFRRTIIPFVKETNQCEVNVRHRPSKLYEKNCGI